MKLLLTLICIINWAGNPYAELKRNPDSGYYRTTNNVLKFIYVQEYNVPAGATLAFKIYNNRHEDVTPSRFSEPVAIGINKYSLAFNTCDNLSPGIYLLEVTNNKNEKQYLKFSITAFTSACEGTGGDPGL